MVSVCMEKQYFFHEESLQPGTGQQPFNTIFLLKIKFLFFTILFNLLGAVEKQN